jgi:hypothetical protein
MTHETALDLAPLYVLGALDRDEEVALQEHLATCDLAHDAVDELGGVVPALIEHELATMDIVEPPAGLKARILAEAAADRPPVTADGPGSPVPFPSDADRVARAERTRAEAARGERTRGERTRTSAFDWALRIAAVVAIAASGLYGWNASRQVDAARAFDQAVAAVVGAGSQPNAKTVVLATQKDQHGGGIGAVTADGSVVLALRDLAATNGTQSYTAWVIVGNAAPVNVGDFSVDASGVRSFTTNPADTPEGAIIAVTLEPNAGNPAPQGAIVMAGAAAAPPPAANG